jgi:hypothetical protein
MSFSCAYELALRNSGKSRSFPMETNDHCRSDRRPAGIMSLALHVGNQLHRLHVGRAAGGAVEEVGTGIKPNGV